MSTITGYRQDTQGTWIPKDTEAKLVYTIDWSHWLAEGENIESVEYSHNGRLNDSNPLIIHSSGLTNQGLWTYAEISGGTAGRVYVVTADITLDSGARDRRAFKLKVENRFA